MSLTLKNLRVGVEDDAIYFGRPASLADLVEIFKQELTVTPEMVGNGVMIYNEYRNNMAYDDAGDMIRHVIESAFSLVLPLGDTPIEVLKADPDTLVLSKVDGEWPEFARLLILSVTVNFASDMLNQQIAGDVLDALLEGQR